MIANHTDEIRQGLSAHRALTILQLLDGPLRGGTNERLLTALFEMIQLRTSRAELRSILDFLESEGAISTTVVEGLTVIVLKYHGHEIATGLVSIEGIEKPKPDASYLE
ncbi:hypothetical protein [Sphingobium sp.]|uniref:hypothetical protein n=1 Tax=Sphingobium sp. TaxID=1912891 RepID=UPI002C60AF9B|nr:hypothetical protein [Sphingobium sp.]HUD95089.1 hypothetical protein [Sphingobium sp.]